MKCHIETREELYREFEVVSCVGFKIFESQISFVSQLNQEEIDLHDSLFVITSNDIVLTNKARGLNH